MTSWSVDHNLYLDRAQAPGVLDLRHRGAVDLEYRGDGDGRAVFRARTADLRVDLEISREGLPFTRRDNYFRCSYALLHRFFNRVRGEIEAFGRRFAVDTARSYYDHCFGVVPRRASWQWLAVQNDDIALASRQPRRLCPALHPGVLARGVAPARPRRRLRLRPRRPHGALARPFAGARPGRAAPARPLRPCDDSPLVPFLVDLQHNELFVEVEGEMRLGGVSVPLRGLTGVAEEHDGRW
ncbi:hypothetical protein [Nannocystis pusilla]|uniref:hypothetical protein n=1 Tax=Nannocystis pusilla TaxID=889268 RepID=UPI003B80CFD1